MRTPVVHRMLEQAALQFRRLPRRGPNAMGELCFLTGCEEHNGVALSSPSGDITVAVDGDGITTVAGVVTEHDAWVAQQLAIRLTERIRVGVLLLLAAEPHRGGAYTRGAEL